MARATLHVEPAAIRPGQPFLATVRLELPEHWHVYWRNPGDSGLAPKLGWTLPFGFSAGPIQWGAPKAIRVSSLTNYGFEGEAFLLTRIDPPASAAGVARLSVLADWLVCQEECIPERAALTLEVPIGDTAGPGPDAALFARAKSRLPRTAAEAGFSAAITAEKEGAIELRFAGPPGVSLAQAKGTFFPADGELIEHGAQQKQRMQDESLVLALQRSPIKPGALERMDGVLLLEQQGAPPLSVELTATAARGAVSSATTLPLAVGLALLGGILLNLMPCVLPVLALKTMSFARAAHGDPARARAQALWFAAGVIASFWVLAAALLAVRSAGAQLGWGFQLQNPRLVAGLALLFFALGLSFLGVFELGGSLAAAAGGAQYDAAQRGGAAGSFASGVLATVVATPCTAPFMGTALGYALVAPAPHALAVFTALGAGMALPYLALSASPRAARIVPRPGRWMDVLKQALAFPLFATALWLLWVLSLQAGSNRVLATVGAMVVLGFGLWLWKTARWPIAAIAAAVLALFVSGLGASAPSSTPSSAGQVAWIDYSPAKLADARAAGKPVYVDFTAAWCITCQVNERVVFSSAEVIERFARLGVVALRADWTNRDDAIGRALAEHGRSGVPLNLLYAAGKPPEVLPTVLTPGAVLAALDRAADR